MNRNLAGATLNDLISLDRPIGKIVELTKALDDTANKAILKECCGQLLRVQFHMIERITNAYPDLRKIDPASSED